MKINLIFFLTLLTSVALQAQLYKTPTWKPGLNAVQFDIKGTLIVGTLFLPANYKTGDRLPAVLVDGPWTQVKEQVHYRYGQELSQRGYAVLAIDHRNFGESGGKVREYESPEMKVADLKAAIGYLKTNPAVDASRIGVLGICFGVSYTARLLAEGNNGVKSYATVAAWLHDTPSLKSLYGAEGLAWRRKAGETALAEYRQNGIVQYVPAYHPTERAAMMGQLPYYARRDRGFVPTWHNNFAAMSWVDFLNLDGVNPYAPKIAVPTLMVHSDGSALPDNARKFYSLLSGPKELVWLQGEHTEFYDKDEQVTAAADAVAKHFRKTL
jgi:uncharacterized protein